MGDVTGATEYTNKATVHLTKATALLNAAQ